MTAIRSWISEGIWRHDCDQIMNIRGYLAAWLRSDHEYQRVSGGMTAIRSWISEGIWQHDCELQHSTFTELWDWWVDSWLSGVVMEIRLLKFTPDRRTAGVRLTWTVLVIRTGLSDLLFFTKSWSSLIDRSVNERDDGRRWMPCLNFLCFLLPPRRDRFLGTSTPICSERRWEIRSGVKRAGVTVISWSWARLYCTDKHTLGSLTFGKHLSPLKAVFLHVQETGGLWTKWLSDTGGSIHKAL